MTPSEKADSFEQAQQDERWMHYAMALAARAEGIGEIPVGAVLVLGDEVVGEGGLARSNFDRTCGGEIDIGNECTEMAGNGRDVHAVRVVNITVLGIELRVTTRSTVQPRCS